MALNPIVYARLLGEKLARHRTDAWLVNTGWIGGPYGTGRRIALGHTRAIVHAVLGGILSGAPMRRDPVFGFLVPEECPGVPAELLDPRRTWPDGAAYDEQARRLAAMFRENFEQFAGDAPAAIRAAGPCAS